MKKLILITLGLTLTFFSCEKADESQNSNTFDATITVYNVDEWTVDASMPVCSGAVIKLISSTNTISKVTNDEGQGLFEDLEADIYEIQITKDDLSNLIDKDNSGKGFVCIGIFQSEEEINAYIYGSGNLLQPDAVPGDAKIDNLHYDHKIDDNDRVSATYYTPYVDANADGIIDQDDLFTINENGDMGYKVLTDPDMGTYIGR